MYQASDRQALLELARYAIEFGLRAGDTPTIALSDYSPALQSLRSSFVTLKCGRNLRGCIGQLEAHEALANSVVRNAYAAAFKDPRFSPLRAEELLGVTVSLSVLSARETLTFDSEQHLLQQLHPGKDGLVLQDEGKCGTFLPSVWKLIPEPADFLRELKNKAGLASDHWSDTVTVARYSAETFGEADGD
ncbi:MAG: AmmeMemoRadiSam system protein A [Gammaproteobacteria bacterium]|nr:AmmeMemoRadiSam system protein A [Gammaproteobacteria bacterium]